MRGTVSPPSRCATRRCEPWVIETTTWLPLPVRSRSSSAARIFVTAPSAPAARSAIWTGGNGRRGVPEHAGPAEVVEVVARALLVAAAEAEAGDRAVDGAFRHVLGADAEPRRDAGAKRLEHDVGLAQELERRARDPASGRPRATPSPRAALRPRRGRCCACGSPPGGSTQTTRAPSSSSSRDAKAPGRYRLKSTTSIPLSGCIRRRT